MERIILKCISTIEEFDISEHVRLNMGVEIQDFTEANLTEKEFEDLTSGYKKLLKDFEYKKALHGPFLDLKPSSPDDEIRHISFKKYLRTLRIAKELGMDYCIFHSQINPYLNEPFLMELNNTQARDFWHEIMGLMYDYKGLVLIENIFEETPDMIKSLIETIALPNVKINLDIGHARLGEVSLEKWIRELSPYLAYMHLHSNNNIYDQHKVPSDFEIEALINLLDKYNVNPVISLEYKSADVSREIELLRK
jgi:sugar phosphate isomerase/epimerase